MQRPPTCRGYLRYYVGRGELTYETSQTFYLDLDLSSYHGPVKPARKRSSAATQDPSASAEPAATHVPQAMLDIDPNLKVDPALVQQDGVQVMDLHTANPVVSYKNQVFTCSWVDLLGTELVFASPDETSDMPTLRKETDFELLSASRVKVMGQKANLISASPSNMQHQQQQQRPDSRLPPTNQGRFLQRLADTKQARGERDTVRTSFPTRRLYDALNESLWDWDQTETRMAAEPGQSSSDRAHGHGQNDTAIQEPAYVDDNAEQP